jgi:hypothetical protein
VRELVLGTSLFVLCLIALELPRLPGARADVAGATTFEARPSAAAPILSGAGFAVCAADAGWQRPSDMEQRAHLAGDRRADGVWEIAGSTGYEAFRAPAVLYDGKSVDGLQWIATLTGLWNVWSSSGTRPQTCWTEQPQVFLFGYEAVAYDAQDPKVALLKVRPASGYRMVVLTGPIRSAIAIVADRKLDELVIPATWVTPAR